MIVLKNKLVAEKFEASFDQDPVVHVPGSYRGKLSDITLDAAEKLIAQKSNLLKAKIQIGSNVPYDSIDE